jgi:hypothetical protein
VWFEKSSNGFFKWLLAFAVINIILSFESMLFCQFLLLLYAAPLLLIIALLKHREESTD